MYYQKHDPWFIWIMVAFMIFDVVLHVIIYVITRGGGWGWLLLSFLPSMSILSFFAYFFRFYFVSTDHDQLRFGYALWSVRLNLADIAQIEETNIKWIKWGGQG